MGSEGKIFHRLALPLPYAVQKRRVRLGNLFRLSHYRVRTLEISQICTTFVYGTADNEYIIAQVTQPVKRVVDRSVVLCWLTFSEVS
jgi:hypothetical protein